jgi:hypothetical protein
MQTPVFAAEAGVLGLGRGRLGDVGKGVAELDAGLTGKRA